MIGLKDSASFSANEKQNQNQNQNQSRDVRVIFPALWPSFR